MKTIAYLLGALLIVVAAIYLLVPADSLPAFFPGHEAGLTRIRIKHGLAAGAVGIVLLAVGWFVGATRKAESFRPPSTAKRGRTRSRRAAARGVNGLRRQQVAPRSIAVRKKSVLGRAAAGRIARHHDDRHVRRVLAQNADGLEPVHARHDDVDDHDVEREGLDRAHRRVPAFGDHDAIAFLRAAAGRACRAPAFRRRRPECVPSAPLPRRLAPARLRPMMTRPARRASRRTQATRAF